MFDATLTGCLYDVPLAVLLQEELPKELKAHERFVMAIAGEYGCKNAYSFSELHEFIPGEHITSSNEVMTGEDDY